MIKISKKEWDKIPNDYKGRWTKELKTNGWQPNLPDEYIGKRTVLSGCISNEIGCLLTENIHFKIVE